MDIDQRAEELHESWINGNLTFVVGEITSAASGSVLTRPDVILCVALTVKLAALMSERERSVLIRILKDKL